MESLFSFRTKRISFGSWKSVDWLKNYRARTHIHADTSTLTHMPTGTFFAQKRIIWVPEDLEYVCKYLFQKFCSPVQSFFIVLSKTNNNFGQLKNKYVSFKSQMRETIELSGCRI